MLHVPADHTAATLQSELISVLEDWELQESRLVAITTDNASNIVKATKDLGNLFCFVM